MPVRSPIIMPVQSAPMGRPVEIPNRVTLYVYLTAGEQRRIARAARREKVSSSAWMRTLALAALNSGAQRSAE
jgi:hypothetical protein